MRNGQKDQIKTNVRIIKYVLLRVLSIYFYFDFSGRIPESEFELIIFGNDCLINKSIDEWPVVDCLIAFYSDGFPLAKAIDYADLRQPFLVNDLRAQLLLLNRHTVYTVRSLIHASHTFTHFLSQTLQNSGVPVPKYAVIEDRYHDLNLVEEYDDYIVVKGVVINKPLVEKPIDAEDHNVKDSGCCVSHN